MSLSYKKKKKLVINLVAVKDIFTWLDCYANNFHFLQIPLFLCS